MADAAPILSARHLSLFIEQCPIVSDISVDIYPGEVVSVIGPNGAGKTTLLKLLLGVFSPHAGQIYLEDRPMSEYKPRERARWVGYVPQNIDISLACTVEEYVLMGRYPYLQPFSMPTRTDHEAVDRALDMTHTEHLRKRFLHTLSGGERQKILIAGALAQQTPILLLDEPASFLDPRNEMEVQSLLSSINRSAGTAILMVTHNLNHALQISEKIVALKQGECVYFGTPDDLLKRDCLASIFGIRFQVVQTDPDNVPMVFPERVVV